MSLIGKELENFKVQSYYSGEFREITLESVKGHWSVFAFYPADFVPVCLTELGDLAESYDALQKTGCEVYAVSTDSCFVHKAWADASEIIRRIPYPILADPAGKLARMFDVLNEEEGMALCGTFIVNPDGVVKACAVSGSCGGQTAGEILHKVQAAQLSAEHSDQLCPAKQGAASPPLSRFMA